MSSATCRPRSLLRHLRSSVVVAVLCLFAMAGCTQKMVEQPRYEPYEPSAFFSDSLSARPLVVGTVPRGDVAVRRQYSAQADSFYDGEGMFTGRAGGAGYEQHLVDAFPFPVTRTVLERGQQQFDIFCSPCHGRLGNGQGMVVQRGLHPPPSFHTDRLRAAPTGHFFDVITNGYGAMYSYGARVAPADRWAIVAYIRALQLSQHATLANVPSDRRAELQLLNP